jgi:tetraacyldisaccharide 4'-kinase
MRAPWRQALERALLHMWRERGAIAWMVWPVSCVFGAIAAIRRALFATGILRSERVGVPVIVVGNVVAGGAGKTPVVIALVLHLQQRGLQVGVVSRGYGRDSAECAEVHPHSTSTEVGDEPALIKYRTRAPVFVASKRADAARALLRRSPDTQVIVCDDGLQHLALQRDIEVCVFDDRGVGNGFQLPAGPLREPWPRTVDFVLHSGAHPAFDGYTARRALADEAQRADGTRCALSELRNRRVIAVAGIARPEEFFGMLKAQGLLLSRTIALPDHYDFNEGLDGVAAQDTLLCTEKDAVKLWVLRPEAWAVPLVTTLEPTFLASLDARLDAKLSFPHGRQTS